MSTNPTGHHSVDAIELLRKRETIFRHLGARMGCAVTLRQAAEVALEVADELWAWDSATFSLYSRELDTISVVLAMDIVDGKRAIVPLGYRGVELTPRQREVVGRRSKLILREPSPTTPSDFLPIGDKGRPSLSLMYVPMCNGDDVVGMLSVQSYTPNAYTKEDLELLQCLADHCGGMVARLEAAKSYDSIFEHAIEGLSQTTPDGRLLRVNPAMAKMAGYESPTAMMACVKNLGEDLYVRAEQRQELRRLLEEHGELRGFEAELRHQTGRSIFVSINSHLVLDDAGAPNYYENSVKDITESRLAETKLRRMEELYRRAISGGGAVPYSYDYRTRSYLFMGDGIEQLIGYPASEVSHELWVRITKESVMLGETSGLAKDEAARRVVSGELRVWRCDMRIVTREGNLRWLADVSVQNLDEKGRPTGSMGILEDITERKQAELTALALSKLGQRLIAVRTPEETARVVSTVADELFTWDACTFYLYFAERDEVSAALYMDTIDGLKADVPAPVESTKPTKTDRRILANGAELILKDLPLKMESGAIPYGDTSRPSASIMRVPVIARGKPVGILSVHSYTAQAYSRNDLNTFQTLADYCGGALERIWGDEAVRKSETQLRLVWESSGDGMRLTDGEGRILMVNDAFCRMVEKSRAELDGHLLSVIQDEENGQRALEAHRKRVETVSIEPQAEREVTLWNGRKVWFEFSNSRLDLPGQPFLLLSIFRDITRRKQAEAELETMHRQLMSASRQAGMAEVATSVLHNVGNVLNSVNISTSLVSDKIRNSKVPNVSKLADLLEAHKSDLTNFLTSEPRGKQVASYLSNLGRHLAEEQEEILHELASLRNNVDHIKEIVAMQQSYGKVSGVIEEVAPAEMVEDALRMNEGAMERHHVRVIREYEETPPVAIDRHKVLQILVNLIRNAKYALDDAMPPEKRLVLRIENKAEDRVRLLVIDNGIGIPPENLTRIFGHGFTTRKDGHGFGLHSGALAARELGGSLTVESEGAGKGAAFVLEIPVKPRAQAA